MSQSGVAGTGGDPADCDRFDLHNHTGDLDQADADRNTCDVDAPAATFGYGDVAAIGGPFYFEETYGQDDLGKDGGNRYFPHAGDARRIVLSWAVASFGERPKDYLTRDLLLGSLYRDRRQWMFHALCKNKPAWTAQDTGIYEKRQRELITRLRLLHYAHLTHLLDLREHAGENVAVLIDRVVNCWPQGAKYRWAGRDPKGERDVCGLPRLCPFCLARSVRGVYDRISEGPWRNPSDKLLVLGVLSATDAQLSEFSRSLSARDRVHLVRTRIADYLIRYARRIGVDGGIVTFQMEPILSSEPVWDGDQMDSQRQVGFRYNLAVLGHVGERAARLLDFQQHGEESGLRIGSHVLQPSWKIEAGSNPQALRTLLVRPSSIPREEGTNRGAFILPPWNLANYDQWRLHFELTQGMRLFTTWGTWKGRLARLAPKQPRLVNVPARRGEIRRQLAFRRRNAATEQATRERRSRLLETCRPILMELLQQHGGLPGRVVVAQTLADQDHIVSERDLRWILKQFRDGQALVDPGLGRS